MYTYLNRLVGFIKGPLSIILILAYYDETEQGYWYLLVNLGVIASVIDFGLASLLTQRVSRVYGINEEYSSLESSSRIYFLIKQFIKYYLILVSLFSCYTILIFLFFLDNYNHEWLIYGGLLIVQFSFTPFYHIFMGLNKVEEVQSALFKGNIVGAFILILSLWLGYGLWSLGISLFLNIIVSGIFFLNKSLSFWKLLYKISSKNNLRDQTEDLKSVQFDYFISWVAGLFMYNLFIPYISKIYDIILVGKIGLILNLFSFILSLSVVEAFNNIPYFNVLIQKNKIQEGFKAYKAILSRSLLLFVVLILSAFLFLFVLNKFIKLENRLPDYTIIICFGFWIGARIFTSVSASFFRSFGGEPYRNLNIVLLVITLCVYLINHKLALPFSQFLIILVSIHLILLAFYYLMNYKAWLVENEE